MAFWVGLFDLVRRSLEGAERPRTAPVKFDALVDAVETDMRDPGDAALWPSLSKPRLSFRRPREDKLELRPLVTFREVPSPTSPREAGAEESRPMIRLVTFLAVAEG